MSEPERIAQLLANIRKEKNLTQEQVAELSGLKQQNISRAESGKHSTTLLVLSKILTALGKKIDISNL